MPSFFVYDPPPSAIYTLSLHDALPILLEGVPVTVRAMDEGTLFGPYQPVLTLDGTYVEWARYETALLGLICQASGIATKAARCKKAAGERQVISFGARRMHPTIAPMIERNAFIGGCDGVAVTKSAELIDADPMGDRKSTRLNSSHTVISYA